MKHIYAFLMFNTFVICKFAILTLLQETPKGFSVIRDQNYSCNQKGFQSNNHLILVMLALGFFHTKGALGINISF